mmetsp:Transcript_74477/g.91514  ORF Transcript_74477/g.91514 Transcript_74477/m.91514 type:complete len:232 (+) Transcript_74477:32-727(+)
MSFSLNVFVFMLLFCCILIYSQNNCGTSSDDIFTKNEKSPLICLQFDGLSSDADPTYDGPFSAGSGQLYFLSQTVDLFTLNQFNGSSLHRDQWSGNENGKITIEAGGINSTSRQINTNLDADPLYVTQLTTIISLVDGKVSAIDWDDTCAACGDEFCVNGNCGIPRESCVNGDINCELKIYISWYGTDKNGEYLLSAGQRISQFEDSTAESYYNYVKDSISPALTTILGGN